MNMSQEDFHHFLHYNGCVKVKMFLIWNIHTQPQGSLLFSQIWKTFHEIHGNEAAWFLWNRKRLQMSCILHSFIFVSSEIFTLAYPLWYLYPHTRPKEVLFSSLATSLCPWISTVLRGMQLNYYLLSQFISLPNVNPFIIIYIIPNALLR